MGFISFITSGLLATKTKLELKKGTCRVEFLFSIAGIRLERNLLLNEEKSALIYSQNYNLNFRNPSVMFFKSRLKIFMIVCQGN